MQCILREKLLAQATKLAIVSKVYHSDSTRFVSEYFGWLIEAEKDLATLRSPVGILLQAEKTSLTSVLDGNLPDHLHSAKSTRKNQRAVAAQSLERISREFYSKIEKIDQSLEQMSDKLCPAVAVLASKEPGVFEGIEPNQQGIVTIWRMLGSTPETAPMYHYLCARLAPTDRDYLLTDIIQNIVSNRADS